MIAAVIILGYLLSTIAIGYVARRGGSTASRFLHAKGGLPTAVTAIAFLAANCGALDIVGLVATSAKYGIFALHFYWLGAVPAMLFLAFFMMPIYLRSGALTVPDFLRVRFGTATHILSASCLGTLMIFVSGVALYAISSMLHTLLGYSFLHIAVASTAVVLCYLLIGGLEATMYNEVLQFVLIVAGLIPLAIAVQRAVKSRPAFFERLPTNMVHLWTSLPLISPRASSMDIFGLVVGLGFIVSFGYWCTDFLLIQRALAARTRTGSINTPLFAAFPKMFFPILIVLPGMAAAVFFRQRGLTRYDQSLLFLMQHFYGRAMLGLGVAAILASLMSGLAGNISAFSTLWTHDLYRAHLRPGLNDAHYLLVARLSALAAGVLGVLAAYISLRFNNLMDYLMLLVSLFNAPLFAVFLLGMFTTWATAAASFWGLLGGVSVAGAHNLAVRFGWMKYGSQMVANFYGGIYGWSAAMALMILVSCFTRKKSTAELKGITCFTQERNAEPIPLGSWILGALILVICGALNWAFR